MAKRSTSKSKTKAAGKSEDKPEGATQPRSVGRTQWLKGVLELCVLSIVSRGEAYGYEVAQELDLAGLGQIKGGTLYPRLAALEKDGLVEIEWRVGENGPGRKYYRITPEGLVVLSQSVQDYGEFASVVRQILETGRSDSTRDPAEHGDESRAVERAAIKNTRFVHDTEETKL